MQNRLSLYIAQLTLRWDDGHASTGGVDTPLIFDDFLLKHLGVRDKDIQELQIMAKSHSTHNDNRYMAIKPAGGLSFGNARRALAVRFCELVVGDANAKAPIMKEDRSIHMHKADHWIPIVRAFESAYRAILCKAFLLTGLAPNEFGSPIIGWSRLTKHDWNCILEAAHEEPSLKNEIMPVFTRDEDDSFRKNNLYQSWLKPCMVVIKERCIANVKTCIDEDNHAQIQRWSERSLSSLLPEQPAVESAVSTSARFRALEQAIKKVTVRPDDDSFDEAAAVFLRNVTLLEAQADIFEEDQPNFVGCDGETIQTASGKQARDLYSSIYETLHQDFFEPAREAAAAAFVTPAPAAFIAPEDRHEKLTKFRSRFGGYDSQAWLDEGIIALGQPRNYLDDPAERVIRKEQDIIDDPPELPEDGASQVEPAYREPSSITVDLTADLAVLQPVLDEEIERLKTPEVQAKLKSIWDCLQSTGNTWSDNWKNRAPENNPFGGFTEVFGLLDSRTLVRRILSGYIDTDEITEEFANGVSRLFDELICVTAVLQHPAIWMLALEALTEVLPDFPDESMDLVLEELLLIMRCSMADTAVMSDAIRKSFRKDQSMVLKAVTFIVGVQGGKCSREDCRQAIFAHPSTLPQKERGHHRLLTTSAVYTRCGNRTKVIRGGMGVPKAVLRSPRGPCPWYYFIFLMTCATLAALVRVTKFEHKLCKYKRDRRRGRVALRMHRTKNYGQDVADGQGDLQAVDIANE